ncbi:MAG: NapC/NirT family cytochrome c [Betaproteobacteria bacterium]|jgi:cytochrome c-type protein NapC|nr:NapC/NirT family cytochrome c [Betaproteobacteria bacterium]MBK7656458.1 NapC/NirT family cytochrome c [Betaproteobacteria bacterium]
MSSQSTGNSASRWWAMLRKPSVKYSLITLLTAGFFGGIIFWGAFNTGMEATNKLEFCVGCHEMKDNVYEEYKYTIHYANRSGVRAVCSDCHVPKDWTHKIIRKVQASKEVFGKITGVIDTKEKFEAHRLEMAEREWARMKSVDSIECRNCHSFDAMNPEIQKKGPYKKHMEAKAEGKSCIDCHKGIAHKLPKGYKDPNAEEE